MTHPAPIDVLSLEPDQLRARLDEHFAGRSQPSYRTGQVVKWVYERLASGWDEMTDLPATEREALASAFRLSEPTEERVAVSKDGTVKHLWRLEDGALVESVLIPTRTRLTLCISSQAGCAMGCTFCATGWGGFERQLTAGEIVSQYRASRRWAEAHDLGAITNIVYMGMGEPLANRKALHPSLTILNRGYDVGARRITVSTVGVVPGILELADRPEQFRLALSLHSPDSELRRELIPLEKRHPLPEVLDALEAFDQAGGKRITFEYTMIRGVNDALELAPRLADLAMRVNAFVNLIPFNPIPYRDWRPSDPVRIAAFARILEGRGVSVAVRGTRGRDIDAACGQLRAHVAEQLGAAAKGS
ncbi:MAG: 23S rRNA (adenine(2503)-C(2))-methyltransferase RlmN [Gemmatimonadota bacterium]|nr:23S rRNA (adenine(2503)-C(2))-methyltransferase RlmN [Gemmatimonadota bacterium]MDH5760014.1 23S rRNA (adenine(2503)-C(2))-methyltransferase RlmN [Gemmatimonadota bacterium]